MARRFPLDAVARLNQQPMQRIIVSALIEVALLTGQFHDLAQFGEGETLRSLVKCLDEFPRLSITAVRFK